MTRRDLLGCLVDIGRIALLKWRVVRGRALPAFAMALLSFLDRQAKR
jgi:hypothetical protein